MEWRLFTPAQQEANLVKDFFHVASCTASDQNVPG